MLHNRTIGWWELLMPSIKVQLRRGVGVGGVGGGYGRQELKDFIWKDGVVELI